MIFSPVGDEGFSMTISASVGVGDDLDLVVVERVLLG